MRAGNRSEAMRLVRAARGKAAFDLLRARIGDLQERIDDRVAQAQEADRRDLTGLKSGLLFAGLGVVIVLLLGAWLLRRWVLLPVQRLRARMREVAAGHLDEEVLVDGPPEVAAIGRDAESMRRRIRDEVDAVRGATEALGQQSPVVAALRLELVPRRTSFPEEVDLDGAVRAAEGVLAGDSWGAILRPDGRLLVVVTDVSGHGAEAGLLAFGFRQRLDALLATELPLEKAFEVAAGWTSNDEERFLSCLLLELDPASGEVRWINAGHPSALVMTRSPRAVRERLEPTGPLVSAVTSGWTTGSAQLDADELVVLFSDGVVEARSEAGQELGETGLVAALTRATAWSASDMVADVLETVERHAADRRRDDVTCVVVRRVPTGSRPS